MEKERTVGLKANLLKASEVAYMLNISKAFAYKLMRMGEIRTVQIKRARRVRPEDLEEYIASNLEPLKIF